MVSKKFLATIKQNGDMDAAYIEIPYEVEKEFGKRRVKVVALLNGVEYRGSIVRMGTTCLILGIPKLIRNKMGVTFGDTIDVEIAEDIEIRTVTIPADLNKKLDPKLLHAFQSLSYSKQKEYVLLVESAKHENTRNKRIKEIILQLSSI